MRVGVLIGFGHLPLCMTVKTRLGGSISAMQKWGRVIKLVKTMFAVFVEFLLVPVI